MKKHYRSKIQCLNCGESYTTNLLNKPIPNYCKHCGSIKLFVLKKWRF